MPRGDVHDTANGLALFGLYLASRPLVAQGVLREDEVALTLAGFVVGSYLVTPDLDMAADRRVRPLRFWGPLGVIWRPYGRLMRHRGTSHTWVVGPVSRLAYLLLFLWPLLLVPSVRAFFTAHAGLGVFVLGGYLLAQWAHVALDRFYARPMGRPRTRPR